MHHSFHFSSPPSLLSTFLALSTLKVSESVKEYADKLEAMKAECEDLKDREESLKRKEKTLHSEMKKKGDLARQMLAEKDVYIQQLLSNNNTNNNTNSATNGSSNTSGSSNSGTTFIQSNLDTAAPTHAAAALSNERSSNGSGQRPSGRPIPGSARPTDAPSSSSKVRERGLSSLLPHLSCIPLYVY